MKAIFENIIFMLAKTLVILLLLLFIFIVLALIKELYEEIKNESGNNC